jgi:16S rRNA (adenine1518-N6/adenine1519-N6)-dimethyltransferase
LIDPGVIENLIHAAGVDGGDTVLEVGPGCGNITVPLAERARKIIAVEKDHKFLPCLEERLRGYNNVDIIIANILDINLPVFTKLVSNIPYSISEALIQKLYYCTFTAASIMVSKGFADILTASVEEPGYSKLSLLSQKFYNIELIAHIPPKAYYPEPNTSTSIILISPKPPEDLGTVILREVILQNDKKLKNALREALIIASITHGGPSTKREARRWIEFSNIPTFILEKRVARLSKEDIEELLKLLKEQLE